MPPVAGAIIKERARRLREAGEAALGRHHARQIGRVLRVLTERGGLGRAADFTCVRTDGAPPGLMLDVAIERDEGKALAGAVLRTGRTDREPRARSVSFEFPQWVESRSSVFDRLHRTSGLCGMVTPWLIVRPYRHKS